MVAQEHLFDDLGVPIYRQGVIGKAVSVEQDVWIGANCTILGGVMIGQGTVVTKNVTPYTVVGGVTARFIRKKGYGGGDVVSPG